MSFPSLWEVTAFLVASAYNSLVDIPDRMRIARNRNLEILHRSDAEQKPAVDFSRTAIVAIYPSAESLPFTINLLTALRRLRFRIMVLSTKRLSTDTAQRLLQHCDHLIERRPIGRDFGSYQMGWRLLKEWGVRDRLDMLVLANDSMFYQSGFSSIAETVVSALPTWGAIFENYEYHYHAQSFFQVFSREAINSRAFQRFWAAYKPFSSRKHAIVKGEVGLTRAMRRAGFQPTTYYTSSRLITAFLRHIENSNDLSSLHRTLNAQFGEAYIRCIERFRQMYGAILQATLSRTSGQAPDRPLQLSTEPLHDTDITAELVHHIGANVERRNPTHAVALLANFLCGAPIKRDVAYRGALTIGEVLEVAAGYTDAERAAMETDLRARGTPAMFRGVKRMLYYKGSI